MLKYKMVITSVALLALLTVTIWPSAVMQTTLYAQNNPVVQIRPPLLYRGHRYTVEYRATGDYNSDSSSLFFQATPEFFTRHGIADLLVRRDGVPITDEEELYQVFVLYTAADALYRHLPHDPSSSIPPGFREDLQAVTRNPVFIEQWIKGLFASREDQVLEAFRAILSPQLETESVGQLADGLEQAMARGNTALEALDETIEAMRFSNNRAIRNLQKDIRHVFEKWRPITEQGTSYVDIGGSRIELFNALDMIALGTRLLWTAQLNRERAEWLALYQAESFSGEAVLDAEQTSAALKVRAEAEEAWLQRTDVILQFAREQLVNTAYRLGTERLARLWVEKSWETFGKRTTGHLVAGVASSALLGLSLGNLLYGLDDLVSNFRVAERADELRLRFRTGRAQLQLRARQGGSDVYDGHLAEAFRAAYMLEALAAAQAYRSYADGVGATVNKGLLDLLNPLNWFVGEDWREAIRGLRELADQDEREAYDALGHPPYVDTAVALAQETARRLIETPEIVGLAALPAAPLFFDIVQPNEPARLVIALRNTGTVAWEPDQDFALTQLDHAGEPTGETYPLLQAIGPGESGQWEILLPSPAQRFTRLRFQLTRAGRPFGAQAQAVVITLPEPLQGLEERLRTAIERQIEAWRSSAEDAIEQRLQELETFVLEWIQSELEKQVNNLLEQLCSGAALAPLALLFVHFRRHRARS